MKVTNLASLDGLLALLSFDREIEIEYTDLDKLQKKLDSVDVTLLEEVRINKDNRTISINPEPSNIAHEYKDVPAQFGGNIKGYKPIIIDIPDFNNSEQLYAVLSGDKSFGKIITDKYSSKRGALLYEYISRMEGQLRKEYIKQFGTTSINPSNYNSKLPDHKINQYGLFEMVEKELLSPASEDFYIKNVGLASSKEDLIKARKLTRLDEMKLPFSNEDFEHMRNVRNGVMHFRVITRQDAEKLLEIAARFENYTYGNLIKEMAKTFKK